MNKKIAMLSLGGFLLFTPSIIMGQEKKEKKCEVCVEECVYAKDSKYVYYHGERILGAHIESFENLGDGYARDKKDAYYQGKKILSSLGASFEVLGQGYAKDAKAAYYLGKKIVVTNAASFRVLNAGEK